MEKKQEKDRLKVIRQSLHETQEDMGKRFNKTQTAWANYETGRSEIPEDVYLKLGDLGSAVQIRLARFL